MDEARKKFDEFCAGKGIEPTDRDYFFWLSALQSTRDQEPAAYGYFGSTGELLQMLDFIQPDRRPKPVPLYALPICNVPKADVKQETLEYVWKVYYAPTGDLMGMLRWLERYIKS